jgi:hypothetical protein
VAVIKLVEDYAVSQLRKDVRDALTLAGELSVLLNTFHPGEPDAIPCPQCGDDIYESPEADCLSCYGTMFDGGVRVANKVWALYTDKPVPEQDGPRGVFRPDARSVQFEAFPIIAEHDVLVRVRRWGVDGTPSELEGFYMLAVPQRRSLRTGSRFGQHSWDVVGQKAQLSELPSSMKMITNYPVLGRVFTEPAQLPPGVNLPIPLVEPPVSPL